jgi:hypothetical protein
MLQVHILKELFVITTPGSADRHHLSAASSLVKRGNRVFVVADDENHLGVFDLAGPHPGRLLPLFDGDLPPDHAARKAAKPDCEALLHLPAFSGYPYGALMALGSGSRPSRQRAALVAFDAAGQLQGPARVIDLGPLLAPLHDTFPDLNIEGAFIRGDMLCLLQRGNGRAGINACIELPWVDLQAWLVAAGPVPRPALIRRFDLGALGGVPLSFTDGAALPDGGWLFSAAAEDSPDTYHDGVCAGSALGIVNPDGTIRRLEPLSWACKVEGVAAAPSGDGLDVWLVTDADDRSRPALLLAVSLRL